ncbi:hypothetical protein BDV98DRAFT_659057 [Pterulicium gracile]|uniref:Uncharacterized protein n=1 Tax=Pterulicium gracile TaxID=1884261 RepID=A0A5C3Q3T9_9AGAR|nr:hypothetical protein BDV98DRAFT_659057 [Pterula gracilis]
MFPEAAVGKTKRLAEFKLLENDNCGERFASSAQRKITIVAQLDSTPKKSEFRWISKNDVGLHRGHAELELDRDNSLAVEGGGGARAGQEERHDHKRTGTWAFTITTKPLKWSILQLLFAGHSCESSGLVLTARIELFSIIKSSWFIALTSKEVRL